MSTKYIASNWRLPNKAGVDSYLNDNYGLTFDGSELIDCGADTNLDLNNSFSISAWIKFTSTSSMVVLSKREATKISLLIELGSGKTFTAIRDASSNIAITNTYSGTYNDGNWHHIIATFDRTANELKLYIDNDGQLYNSRYMPIIKNLSKKMKKGKVDKRLAVKGFMYLVDDGVKKYIKDYGGSGVFTKRDKIEVAKEFADEFEEIYKNKEYDFMEAYDIWAEDGSFGYTMTGIVEAEYGGRMVKLG